MFVQHRLTPPFFPLCTKTRSYWWQNRVFGNLEPFGMGVSHPREIAIWGFIQSAVRKRLQNLPKRTFCIICQPPAGHAGGGTEAP